MYGFKQGHGQRLAIIITKFAVSEFINNNYMYVESTVLLDKPCFVENMLFVDITRWRTTVFENSDLHVHVCRYHDTVSVHLCHCQHTSIRFCNTTPGSSGRHLPLGFQLLSGRSPSSHPNFRPSSLTTASLPQRSHQCSSMA